MLVLMRSLGPNAEPGSDSIRIGPDIRVVVLGVKGHQVRIGIDAPQDLLVLRSELEAIDPKDRRNKR